MPRKRNESPATVEGRRRTAIEMRKAGASLATIANALGRSRNWALLVTSPPVVKQRSYHCYQCGRDFTVKVARRPERCPLCGRYKYGKQRQAS